MGGYAWDAVWCTESVAGSVGALHAPQTLSLRVEHSPMAGRLLPVPMTETVWSIMTTTIISTTAISAAQAGLVYTSYTGLRAPSPWAFMAWQVCGAAG